MSFFQNPFNADFKGSWVLGDRQYSPTFVCPKNSGRSDDTIWSCNNGPYDLSGNDANGDPNQFLDLNYAIETDGFTNWSLVSIDLTNGSALTAADIVATLNAADSFNGMFVATADGSNEFPRIKIKQKLPLARLKFYISNIGAETVLGFNKRAGVAELPTYFARHEVGGLVTFTDSCNMLVPLSPSNVNADVITNAMDEKGNSLGLDSSTVREDWELLGGRTGLFQFTFSSGSGIGSVDHTWTDIIVPAGSKDGDLVKKVITQYDSANNIINRWELPYTLNGDLISPP